MKTKAERIVEERNIPMVIYQYPSGGGFSGYFWLDLKKYLTPIEYEALGKYMAGSTIGVINNEGVVYQHDLYRFLNGLPNND